MRQSLPRCPLRANLRSQATVLPSLRTRGTDLTRTPSPEGSPLRLLTPAGTHRHRVTMSPASRKLCAPVPPESQSPDENIVASVLELILICRRQSVCHCQTMNGCNTVLQGHTCWRVDFTAPLRFPCSHGALLFLAPKDFLRSNAWPQSVTAAPKRHKKFEYCDCAA